MLQERVQALLLLTREDSLPFTIFSSGDGSACGSRFGVVQVLGQGLPRCNSADWISQSSDWSRASRIPLQDVAPLDPRKIGWSQRCSHVAIALSEPKGLRADVELQLVLHFFRHCRPAPGASRCGNRLIPAAARGTFWLVAGPLQRLAIRFRSARSVAGVHGCSGHGRSRLSPASLIEPDRRVLVPHFGPYRRSYPRFQRLLG